jgi:hypothetical protein
MYVFGLNVIYTQDSALMSITLVTMEHGQLTLNRLKHHRGFGDMKSQPRLLLQKRFHQWIELLSVIILVIAS